MLSFFSGNMSQRKQGSKPGPRVQDRLDSARRQLFVGRSAELELFRSALERDEPPFSVLHVDGPGGIGKTVLLGEYARLAAEAGRPVVRIDGHEVQPSPHGVALALAEALHAPEGEDPLVALSRLGAPVLLIDTFELLEPVDRWLREQLMPFLPANSMTVIAGRNRPSEPWWSDPGWSELTRIVALRNLRPEESRALLAARGVASAEHDAILRFTYGHPLALALAAQVSRQGSGTIELATADADIVRALLDRFVATVPGPRHRLALDAAAIALRLTQATLRAALDERDDAVVAEVFAWLRQLPVIEDGPLGLFPHDLVRDLLYEDLRRHHPERLGQVARRIARLESERFLNGTGIEVQRALWGLLFLSRDDPKWRPYYDWHAFGASHAEPARPDDHAAILAAVARYEGEESARIAAHWLRKQPEGFWVFRAIRGEIAGFCAVVRLDRADEDDRAADPAVNAVLGYVERRGPPRPGEGVTVHRFWMDAEGAQTPTAHNMASTAGISLWMREPGLAWSFVVLQDPDRFGPLFALVKFPRADDAAFEAGGRRYTVVGHDWRIEPPDAWWHAVGRARWTGGVSPQGGAQAAPAAVVLSQPEFRDAVRRAYADYARPDALVKNPLARSRLAAGGPGDAPGVEALRARLRAAVQSLDGHPRDRKLYRALWHTYIEPAPTQEAAAELLDLPFSTYRRHLGAGLDRVTEWLWQRELYGPRAD